MRSETHKGRKKAEWHLRVNYRLERILANGMFPAYDGVLHEFQMTDKKIDIFWNLSVSMFSGNMGGRNFLPMKVTSFTLPTNL